ncbi:hypothetical protein PG994_000384 [Apiospora phragmitis]|uniref:Ring-like domain-containing protein n=1 Tax=Apiospora phragmitis TaxID=2905665 RepID=A0ABR1X641_9PEZI
MLEYFTYKKVKKHRAEKAEKERVESANEETHQGAASPSPKVISEPVGTPLLREEDERFLERLTSPDPDDDEAVRPPLPPRIKTPTIEWDSETESFVSKEGGAKGKGKAKATDPKPDSTPGKPKRFATITTLGRNLSQRVRPTANSGLKLQNVPLVTEREVVREETDITRILDDLDLSAKNNKVFSLSADSGEMVRKFNLVLKDLVNGVPTAYGDLTALLDDRDGTLARNYEKLPSSLKKLVTTLPNKLTSTLAPELLAVAAEAQGLGAEEAKKGGIKDAAKNFLTPKSLQDLVTKPGAVVGLLKGIVNALKVRWPAFIGTNVIWSLALFLLLSALWYCHKRGREVRLEAEAAARDPIDGSARIEELPDDPQLPAPSPRRSREERGKVERTPTAASSSNNKKNK